MVVYLTNGDYNENGILRENRENITFPGVFYKRLVYSYWFRPSSVTATSKLRLLEYSVDACFLKRLIVKKTWKFEYSDSLN